MPAYKDKKRGTWYVNFYYQDWTGTTKQKRKRGFKREKDAKEWERNFLNSLQVNTDITFSNLVENYMEDLETRLKPTTIETKRNIIESKLLPFFGKLKIVDIDELAVRRWQNELLNYRDKQGNSYSETYLKTINNQLAAIMNYATIYYKLQRNPCRAVGSIGKSKADSMKIWTLDEFEQFISYEKKSAGHLAFNILFWTGIREGELLALTREDFTFDGVDEYRLNINKNFEIVKGTRYILTPKTDSSNRSVTIPQFLYHEMLEYYKGLYEPEPDDRIFYFTKSYLLTEIKRVAKLAQLEPIRVHDLRHSHASLLVEMGFNILMVSQRLGHEKVETTWQTYAHLYPDREKMLATQLHTIKMNGISNNVTLEDQLTKFISQFQNQLPEQPSFDNEEIVCWNPIKKEKKTVSKEEFQKIVQRSDAIEPHLATAELLQKGHIELCDKVYCLASKGLPVKYL